MQISEQRKGETLIFFEGLIWAFFPIITVLTYAKIPSLLSLAWSTLVAGAFFGFVVTYKRKWHELKNLLLWKYVLGIVLFIGLLYYGFFFTGLTKTTAGNAGLIALFEVFTSFLFFNVLRKDKISWEYKTGALLMVLGAVVVLLPNFSQINIGDLLILAATFFPPAGNLFQQKAREFASSETILFLRSILSAPLIFLLAFFLHIQTPFGNIQSSWLFLLINGAFIFGLSKLLWLEAIHRISVTKALALNSVTPLLTILMAWWILKQSPNIWQVAGTIPLLIGVFLLTDQIRFNQKKI